MRQSFIQGYLDSLCGVYGIVNAEKIVNNTNSEESQLLFNLIISYLSKKRILKDIVINGINHKIMSNIMRDVVGNRIPFSYTNKRFHNLSSWWSYSTEYLKQEKYRAIILSIGGKENHITVITGITKKRLILFDSGAYGGINSIRRSSCKLVGTYGKSDKYIIYPSQCWYLGRS